MEERKKMERKKERRKEEKKERKKEDGRKKGLVVRSGALDFKRKGRENSRGNDYRGDSYIYVRYVYICMYE